MPLEIRKDSHSWAKNLSDLLFPGSLMFQVGIDVKDFVKSSQKATKEAIAFYTVKISTFAIVDAAKAYLWYEALSSIDYEKITSLDSYVQVFS